MSQYFDTPHGWIDEFSEWFRGAPISALEGRPVDTMLRRERFALVRLAKQLKVDVDTLLVILAHVRVGPVFSTGPYRTVTVAKREGGMRTISIPTDALKGMQRKIIRRLLHDYVVPRGICGFTEGSVIDALTPHLNATWLLTVDFRNAFSSVTRHDVLYALRKDHSWYVANALTDLMTNDDVLPQGAPTSPQLFDIVCAGFDRAMAKLTRNYGGTYTRYADNVFVSVQGEKFPQPLRQGVLKLIENVRGGDRGEEQRRPGPAFGWHKLQVHKLQGNAVHALGLVIQEGKLHNTRAWKVRLRKTLHHTRYLVDHGMLFDGAWSRLQGMMQFAQLETLPDRLYLEYRKIKSHVETMP